MTKDLKPIDLSALSVETLAEMANSKAELVEQNARKTVSDAIDCGRYLSAIKEQIEHGKWAAWLGANWNYSQSMANKYMLISNSERVTNLKDATTIREALRMIGDDRNEKAVLPRADRIPDRVEVVESASEVGQTVVQGDSSDMAMVPSGGDYQPYRQKGDDPNPAPKTNTKHTPATAKANEADRPASMKVTPVIIDEPKQWPEVSLEDLINGVIKKLEHEKQKKAAAKTLRKLADTLDPPTKFAKPTVEDVAEYCRERKNNIDAETFVAHYAANGWKLANGNKLNDWKSAVITWEKRNDSGNKQAGRAIAGSGRIKPDAIDESAITWK